MHRFTATLFSSALAAGLTGCSSSHDATIPTYGSRGATASPGASATPVTSGTSPAPNASSGATTPASSGATTTASPAPKSTATATATVATASPGPHASGSPTQAPTSSPTSSPSPTQTPPPFNDFTTYGYDNQRDEFNPNSTAITPTSLANLHLAWQAVLGNGDYNTQGEPVLATEIPGHAGVLFLGGATGNTYAYDAFTGTLLWTKYLGSATYSCENNYTAYFGVGGSAAYDPASASIYIVGNTNASVNTTLTNTLYRLDGATGNMLGSVNFAPNPVGASELDFGHTSVALANGYAYVGTSATCDIRSWRGRVAAIAVPALSLSNTFFTVWGGTKQPWGGGGVWGWAGVAVDPTGNVVTGVGNASYDGDIQAPFTPAPTEYSAYAETVTSISPDLSKVVGSDHPIPTSAYSGNAVDLDIGSSPVIFTPSGVGCDTEVAVQSKAGTLFLYDETRIGSGTIAQYQLAPATYSDEFLGSPAYSPATGLLYVATPSSSGSLFPPGMIAINPSCGKPSVAWNTAFGPDTSASGLPRSAVSVSAGGVVFVSTPCDSTSGCSTTATSSRARLARPDATTLRHQLCCYPPSTAGGSVWAVDAATGTVLNGGSPILYTSANIRAPVMIDGDWLYVLDTGGNLYGLTLDSRYAATQLRQRPPSPRIMRRWEAPPTAARP